MSTPVGVFALITALVTQPAFAQDRTAEVVAVLDAAMAEARVQLTCSALDGEAHGFLVSYWQDSVTRTLQFLADKDVQPDKLARFAASALPGNMLPAAATPFAEVKAMCDSHPDWKRKLEQFEGVFLPNAVERLF